MEKEHIANIFAVGDIFKGCTSDWADIVEDATGVESFSVTLSEGVALPPCFWLSVDSTTYTEAPTEEPTEEPTEAPTEAPTDAPTDAPTEKPEKKLRGRRSPYAVRIFTIIMSIGRVNNYIIHIFSGDLCQS